MPFWMSTLLFCGFGVRENAGSSAESVLTLTNDFLLFIFCSSYSGESSSNFSRYACVAAAVVCFFFLLGSGGGESESDMLRSGQAKVRQLRSSSNIHRLCGSCLSLTFAYFFFFPCVKRPTTIQTGGVTLQTDDTTKGEYSESAGYQNPGIDADSDIDANGEVASTEDALEKAQKQALIANEESLSRSVEKVLRNIRSDLEELLGDNDDFDEDDINTLVNRIEEKLNDKVNDEMSSRSDDLREAKKAQMEAMVDVDTEGADGQPFDLDEQKQKLAISLRDDIGEAAVTLKGEIKGFGLEIEASVLEAFLKEKYGKTYVAEVEDGKVVSYKKKSTSTSSSSTSKPKSSHSSSSGHKSSSSSSSSSHHHSTSSGTKSSSGKKSSSHSSHHSTSSHQSSSTKKKVEPEEDDDSADEDENW